MTAHALARQLLAGPDLPVHFQYCYGDHWRTQVAPAVDEAEVGKVTHSTYHDMPKVVDEEDERQPPEDEVQTVILLG